MNKNYVFFKPDGQVVCQASTDAPADCSMGLQWVEGGGDCDEIYVDLVTMKCVDKGDYTLEILPMPCTLTIDGVDYYCETQPTLHFDFADTYVIHVDAGLRYKKKEFNYDYQPPVT